MGVIGLILAIIAISVMFFIPVIGLLFGVAALVLAIIELIKRVKNKDSKVLPIIAIILASICIFISSILSLVNFVAKYNYITPGIEKFAIEDDNQKLVGTWYDSKNKLNFVVKSNNTVELYTNDKTTLYIKGMYTIEKVENNGEDEYLITIVATNRIIDGKSYTDSYKTQFDIVTDYQDMTMMNVISYSIYNFEKVK